VFLHGKEIKLREMKRFKLALSPLQEMILKQEQHVILVL
jgi:hypothetical protein